MLPSHMVFLVFGLTVFLCHAQSAAQVFLRLDFSYIQLQQCCLPNWSLVVFVKLELDASFHRTCNLPGMRWSPVDKFWVPYSRNSRMMRKRMDMTSSTTSLEKSWTSAKSWTFRQMLRPWTVWRTTWRLRNSANSTETNFLQNCPRTWTTQRLLNGSAVRVLNLQPSESMDNPAERPASCFSGVCKTPWLRKISSFNWSS